MVRIIRSKTYKEILKMLTEQAVEIYRLKAKISEQDRAIERLERELFEARKNDNRDLKTGRFKKGE
ncbi:MAG: hypothetical protein EOM21_20615 [Gammaproteobacteria bacterium]|nr:hypothetical protein [Gammaproteobacteria bacterium]